VSAGVAQQPLPPDHIIQLADENRIDLHSPLRWHGRLRDEPSRLPWGVAYDIDLTAVEPAGELLPVQGGLRLSFAPHPGEADIVGLHVGDQVALVTQASRPKVFRDDGAFDRRAYLANQGIDLVATLRAPHLIELVSAARPTPATFLAQLRSRLREEMDSL